MPVLGFDPHAGATPSMAEWQRQLIGSIPYAGPVYNLGRLGTAIYRSFNPSQPANMGLPQSDPDYGNPNYIGLGTPTDQPSGSGFDLRGLLNLWTGGGGGIDPNTGMPVGVDPSTGMRSSNPPTAMSYQERLPTGIMGAGQSNAIQMGTKYEVMKRNLL